MKKKNHRAPTKREINLAKVVVVLAWVSMVFFLTYNTVIIWGGH